MLRLTRYICYYLIPTLLISIIASRNLHLASIFLPLILTQKTVDNPAKLLSFKRNKLNKLAACKQQQSRYPLEASCISYNCNDASLNLRHYTKCTTRLSVHRIRFSYPRFVKTTVPETIRKQMFFLFFFFSFCHRVVEGKKIIPVENPSGKVWNVAYTV